MIAGELYEKWRIYCSSRLYEKEQLNYPGDYYSNACFDYYKCIFVHIPKTAGISVCKALFGNLAAGHSTIEQFKLFYRPSTFRNYFKFTFVRNPWDRLHSSYHFLKKGGVRPQDLVFRDTHLTSINSFENFVMNWLTVDRFETIVHLRPQYSFLTLPDEKDDVLVDFVGRFENIENDFLTITRKLGMKEKQLPKENVTADKKNYKMEYTPEMIERVYKLYERDIRLFKYEF